MSFKALLTIVLGLLFLYLLFTVGFPFLLALVVVIFMEPLTERLIKYGRMNRLAAGTLTSTLFTLGLLGAMYMLGMKIYTELLAFFKKVPGYLNGMNEYFLDFPPQNGPFANLSPDQANQVRSAVQDLIDGLQNYAGQIPDMLINIFVFIPNALIFYIVFTVALYLFSYSLPLMKRSFLSMFHEQSQAKVDVVLQNLRNSIFGFLRAQIILSLLTYLVTLTGLLILGVDYAMAIALLIIIVDLLPVLGTGSFIVPWATYSFVVNNDVFLSVGLIILFIVITVFRRVLEPKVLGNAVGIGALPVLISLYVGFELVGVIGMILGPIVVIIYQAMRKEGLMDIKIKLE